MYKGRKKKKKILIGKKRKSNKLENPLRKLMYLVRDKEKKGHILFINDLIELCN